MAWILVQSKLTVSRFDCRWELGCRRITPGLPYLNAVQQPNVNVVREGIERISEEGVWTGQTLHKVDILICATGFNTSFDWYEIVGRGGETLTEKWKNAQGPEAYLGTAIAGLPNYFSEYPLRVTLLQHLAIYPIAYWWLLALLGPNCPIANGSLIPCIESRSVIANSSNPFWHRWPMSLYVQRGLRSPDDSENAKRPNQVRGGQARYTGRIQRVHSKCAPWPSLVRVLR